MRDTEAVIFACQGLEPWEKKDIEQRVGRVNPHLRGAPVEDMLAILGNADTHIAWTESAWIAFGEDLKAEGHDHDVVAYAIHAAALLRRGQPDHASVAAILTRARERHQPIN